MRPEDQEEEEEIVVVLRLDESSWFIHSVCSSQSCLSSPKDKTNNTSKGFASITFNNKKDIECFSDSGYDHFILQVEWVKSDFILFPVFVVLVNHRISDPRPKFSFSFSFLMKQKKLHWSPNRTSRVTTNDQSKAKKKSRICVEKHRVWKWLLFRPAVNPSDFHSSLFSS